MAYNYDGASTTGRPLAPYGVTGINAKNTGSTGIYTTETGLGRFYPVAVLFEATNTASVSIVATISVGTNASSYNNILAASGLAGLTSNNAIITFPLTAAAVSVPASTAIVMNVTVGATATTMTVSCYLIGYYA